MRYFASKIRHTTRVLLPGMTSGEYSHTSIPALKCMPGDLRSLGFFVLDDRTSSLSVSLPAPAPAITTPPQGFLLLHSVDPNSTDCAHSWVLQGYGTPLAPEVQLSIPHIDGSLVLLQKFQAQNRFCIQWTHHQKPC